MKKISLLKSLLSASLLSTAIAGTAQTETSFALLKSPEKTNVEIAAVAPIIVLKEATLITFHSGFPEATNIKWYNMAKGLLHASFNTPGKTNRAMYTKKGKLLYSISYYSKEMLPASVLQEVKDNYSDKSIFGITELNYNGQTVYELLLEDETSWTNIKIAGNEIKDKKVWKKAQPSTPAVL